MSAGGMRKREETLGRKKGEGKDVYKLYIRLLNSNIMGRWSEKLTKTKKMNPGY